MNFVEQFLFVNLDLVLFWRRNILRRKLETLIGFPSPKEWKIPSFARHAQAMVMLKRYYLTLGTVVLFEAKVEKDSGHENFVITIETHFSDINPLRKDLGEMIWFYWLMERNVLLEKQSRKEETVDSWLIPLTWLYGKILVLHDLFVFWRFCLIND